MGIQQNKSVETQQKKQAEKKEKNILEKLAETGNKLKKTFEKAWNKGKTALAVAGVVGSMACEKKEIPEAEKPKPKEEIPTWQGEIPDKISFYRGGKFADSVNYYSRKGITLSDGTGIKKTTFVIPKDSNTIDITHTSHHEDVPPMEKTAKFELKDLEPKETPRTFAKTLEALVPFIERIKNGDDVSQEIVPGTTKTYAQHQAEWAKYRSHGSYESPALLQIIANFTNGEIENIYSKAFQSNVLFIKDTFDETTGEGKTFHLLLQDRMGRHFRNLFIPRFQIDRQNYHEVIAAHKLEHAWAKKFAEILVKAKDLYIDSRIPENTTREKFRAHLQKIGPVFSPILELSAEENEAILQDMKERFLAIGGKIGRE